MIQTVKINKTLYYCCKDICNYISLTKGKRDNEIKKLKRDTIFLDSTIISYSYTKGGNQKCIFLKEDLVPIWLHKLNFSYLDNNQIEKVNDILANFGNEQIFMQNNITDYFEYESKLRDEIYNIGYFNDIKILEKEKTYDFGRIDLYGIDSNNKKVCIELKKNICFSDTKQQLLKYKNSKCFDKIIYCALDINESFLTWLKNNQIIPYTYKRNLVLSEVS